MIETVLRNRPGSRSIGSEQWFRCKSDIYSVATASTWTFRHRGGPTKIYSHFGCPVDKGVFGLSTNLRRSLENWFNLRFPHDRGEARYRARVLYLYRCFAIFPIVVHR